jgi:hypothetical protein
MSPLFPPRANIFARLSLLFVVALPVVAAGFGYYAVRSPMTTEVGVAKAQPIPFSHRQHAGDLGLDCRYCHIAVEESNTAGVPATETCMGCHAQIDADSPAIELVRTSLADAQPLEWIRVHSLADYAYFNHAIHVTQGIGCETCHGRIDQMEVVAKTETLQMAWCLDCHREPERYIRPRDQIVTMGWIPEIDQAILGPQLVAEYGIHVAPLDDCSICHR